MAISNAVSVAAEGWLDVMIVGGLGGMVADCAAEQEKMEGVFTVPVRDTVAMVLDVCFVMEAGKTTAIYVMAEGMWNATNAMATVICAVKNAMAMVN